MKKYFLIILFLCIFSFLLGGITSYFFYHLIDRNLVVVYEGVQDLSQKNNANIFESIVANVSDATSTPNNIMGSFDNNNVSFSKTIRIGFVGDIVPGIDAQPNIFDEVLSYTQRPDLMIGNFEGSVASNEYIKCKIGNKKCFAFNGDDKFLGLLSYASFDVLNTSNNHFNDYGNDGMTQTIKKIQDFGMTPIGIKDKISYINKNNLRIGFVGFSTSWWAEDMNDEKSIKKIVGEARNNSDIVIVVFHGGAEGVKYAHTPNQVEWYLGENRGDVRLFAHRAIDAGADIVFGSGPHVLRGLEKYKDKLIAYSLGNFASASSRLSNVGLLKTSAMIEVVLNKEGSFVSGSIFPLELNGLLHPQADLQNLAISSMNDLSKSDFGDEGVLIEESGEIIFR